MTYNMGLAYDEFKYKHSHQFPLHYCLSPFATFLPINMPISSVTLSYPFNILLILLLLLLLRPLLLLTFLTNSSTFTPFPPSSSTKICFLYPTPLLPLHPFPNPTPPSPNNYMEIPFRPQHIPTYYNIQFLYLIKIIVFR